MDKELKEIKTEVIGIATNDVIALQLAVEARTIHEKKLSAKYHDKYVGEELKKLQQELDEYSKIPDPKKREIYTSVVKESMDKFKEAKPGTIAMSSIEKFIDSDEKKEWFRLNDGIAKPWSKVQEHVNYVMKRNGHELPDDPETTKQENSLKLRSHIMNELMKPNADLLPKQIGMGHGLTNAIAQAMQSQRGGIS